MAIEQECCEDYALLRLMCIVMSLVGLSLAVDIGEAGCQMFIFERDSCRIDISVENRCFKRSLHIPHPAWPNARLERNMQEPMPIANFFYQIMECSVWGVCVWGGRGRPCKEVLLSPAVRFGHGTVKPEQPVARESQRDYR